MYTSYLQNGILCLAAGVVIGCFHFGGLWLTVRGIGEGKSKGFWFFASFPARFLVTLAAIFLATNGQWHGVVFCVSGMLLARRFFVAKFGSEKARVKKESAT